MKKALISSVSILVCGFASGQIATAQQAEIDEVIVTGVRASLKKSLDDKKASIGVIDSLTAEDIGKFPDLNIGEALSRISGVTITRSVGGEGNRVSVRGGQTDWTKVTVNGLSVASGNVGREFDFDVFASELFAGAKVYKSPSADVTEGGLAATIDLRTPKPFELGGRRLAFSASATDYQKGDGNIHPRLNGLYSNTFKNDRIGILLSGSYSTTAVRGDVSEGWGWDDNNRGLETYLSGFTPATAPTILINGQPENDLARLQEIARTTITPELPRLGPQLIERERLGLTGALQLQATDKLELFADVLYAEFTQDELRATIDGIPGFNIGREWTSITLQDRVAVAGQIKNQLQRSETLFREFDTTLTHLTGGAKYDFDDIWRANLTFGLSKASEDELSRTFIWNNVSDFGYDFRVDPRYPNLTGADWLNPSEFVSAQTRFRPFRRDDEEKSVQLDIQADFASEGLRSIKLGVQYRDRTKGQTRLAEIRSPFTADFANYSVSATELFGDSYHSESPFRSDFLLTDINSAGRDILPANLSITDIDPLQTYSVGEETLGAYLKADFSFDVAGLPVNLDTGVRYVETNVLSSGNQQEVSGPTPVSFEEGYSDWLPSINARANISDNLVFRIAANRTMTRPPLANIAPAIAIFPTILSARKGNPSLEPYRANNFDASLEWYLGTEGLLSATFYVKDLETFIVSETRDEIVECGDIRNDTGENVCGQMFQVTSPVNGESGKLKGIELQYQQPFTFLPAPFDGFGVLANLTLADSERRTEDGTSKPLSGQSDTAYNIVGYYDKGDVAVRLAYNYRSDRTSDGRNGFDNITEAYGQLDASAKYTVNDNFELFFEGLNLLGENIYRYQALTSQNGSVNDFGRIINDTFISQGRVLQAGVRGTF